MTLQGQIVPTPNASAEQLKALGVALRRWFAAFLRERATADEPDLDGWIDEVALSDLEAGELPLPALLRLLGAQPGLKAQEIRKALERARATYPLLRKTVPPTHARSVAFGLSLAETAAERDRLLDSLRHHLPSGSVVCVFINGQLTPM